MRKSLSLLVLCFGSNFISQANAQISQEQRTAAILTTLTELVIGQTSQISADRDGELVKDIEWKASYSDSGFSLSASGSLSSSGASINFYYGGVLWDLGDQVEVMYGGSGKVGSDPLALQGRSIWYPDGEKKTLLRMDLDQSTKLGEHSKWGWFRCAEILGVGALGAGISTAATDLATFGAAIFATPWTAGYGFIGGASTGLSLSNYIQTVVPSEKTAPSERVPDAPPAPKRPALPEKGEGFVARNDLIYTATSSDRIFGVQYVSEGKAIVLEAQYSGGNIKEGHVRSFEYAPQQKGKQ
jgi:hypothetical protein